MSLVELKRVTYTYPGGDAARSQALQSINLSVEAEEFVVLAGASGSGKSTLLRAISGLVPHYYGGTFSGELRVGEFDVRVHGVAQLAAVVGSVLQDPETQTVMTTVQSEIAFPLENAGLPSGVVDRGVEEAALALGLGHLLDRRTDQLSGGELQRVALAAALVRRPQILVLDEPTSQLDPVAAEDLLGTLRRINEEWGTAIVIAEHRLERCIGIADRVVALRHGRVVADETPTEFLQWAQQDAPDLQTPASRLFAALDLAPPLTVRDARRKLRAAGFRSRMQGEPVVYDQRTKRGSASVTTKNLWYEIKAGPSILRAIDLEIAVGDRVVLLGRNGAGKSTLLRLIAQLIKPTRGRITNAGRVALLLQNPGDYFVCDRVDGELSPSLLAQHGLAHLASRHPSDLSGGERQRLALAVVLHSGSQPALVCLDEPTRGMDREHKTLLVKLLLELSGRGIATVVATHDMEFAVEYAERAILLGDGRTLADGPVDQVLSGGWYFTTETGRILHGYVDALDPIAGADALKRLCRDQQACALITPTNESSEAASLA